MQSATEPHYRFRQRIQMEEQAVSAQARSLIFPRRWFLLRPADLQAAGGAQFTGWLAGR